MPLTPRSIVLHGRRWFRKVGNSWHSVEIIVDGETVHVVPCAMGGDRQYEEAAQRWLKREGYLPGSEDREPLWRYCSRVGCELLSDVEDVRRCKDLHRELSESESRRRSLRAIARRATVPHARCTPERCLEHEYRPDVEPCV